MTKVVLSNLENLDNPTRAVAVINQNSAKLTAIIETLLSRDGLSPNTMTSNLDMNSRRIINLPAPVSDTEPARIGDLTAIVDDAEDARDAAAASAVAAAESASEAVGSVSDALAAAETSEGHLEAFQVYWVGAHATAPSTDLNGDPLALGALYFNTVSETFSAFSPQNNTGTGSPVTGGFWHHLPQTTLLSLNGVDADDIEDGQTLMYDEASGNFVPVNSGGEASGISYVDTNGVGQTDVQGALDYLTSGGGGGGGSGNDVDTILGDFSLWNAAKARTTGDPARCLFLGDSNVMGHGDNGGTDLFTNGFARQFATLMGWKKGSVYGNQNVGTTLANFETYNPTWSHNGAGCKVDTATSDVIGGKFFTNTHGSVGKMTWAPSETFDYLRYVHPTSANGDPTVVVKIDGTTVDTFSMNVANSLVIRNYSGLALTTHSVEINFSGGGTNDGWIQALEAQDRTNRTPIFIQGGFSGGKAAQMADITSPWTGANQMAAQDFDYTFIYCTINDANTPTAVNTWQASIEKMISVSNTSNGCFMVGYPSAAAATTSGILDQYAQQARSLCRDYGWSYYDSRKVFGHSKTKVSALSYYYDDNHPNAAGHTALAADLYSFIGPFL